MFERKRVIDNISFTAVLLILLYFLTLIQQCICSKRPTAEESHEHRWLLPTEFMIKKRERAVFLGNRLKVSGMICDNISTGNGYTLSKLVQECLFQKLRICKHMAFERQKVC